MESFLNARTATPVPAEAELNDLGRAIAESDITDGLLENKDIDDLVDLFQAWTERYPTVELVLARKVVRAARLFCEELQEDAEGVPQHELTDLNAAIDTYENKPSTEIHDDSQIVVGALQKLRSDSQATDEQRWTAALALQVINQVPAEAAKHPDVEAFWTAVERGWDNIEPREFFEREAPKNGFGSPLAMAVHHMWKSDIKLPAEAIRKAAEEVIEQLELQADEIAREGHNGWANTMRWAAETLRAGGEVDHE